MNLPYGMDIETLRQGGTSDEEIRNLMIRNSGNSGNSGNSRQAKKTITAKSINDSPYNLPIANQSNQTTEIKKAGFPPWLLIALGIGALLYFQKKGL